MTVPENLTPGASADVRITVKNTGNEKADSVSLRVFKDASQPFEFDEKSDFIGKLEPGESGDAVLRIKVGSGAVHKKYLIEVELRGIDEKNNVVIFRRTMPLTVNSGAKGSPQAGMFGALAVLAGAAYYLRGKRRL